MIPVSNPSPSPVPASLALCLVAASAVALMKCCVGGVAGGAGVDASSGATEVIGDGRWRTCRRATLSHTTRLRLVLAIALDVMWRQKRSANLPKCMRLNPMTFYANTWHIVYSKLACKRWRPSTVCVLSQPPRGASSRCLSAKRRGNLPGRSDSVPCAKPGVLASPKALRRYNCCRIFVCIVDY